MDSRNDSFLDDLEDEFVWGRLLAVDPALPECLGGTVILLGKMHSWCVKWGMSSRVSTVEAANSPKKRGFQGISIFKSLHNYHYGTFIASAHSPTPDPKGVQKLSQIANDTEHLLTLLARHGWLGACDIFWKGTLRAISLWARLHVAVSSSSKILTKFACARIFRLTGNFLQSVVTFGPVCSLSLYRRGPHSGASPLQICTVGFWRGKIHTPARPTTSHALAPGAALTYNTANTGFTQARSLHGLCQQLLQLYTVSHS